VKNILLIYHVPFGKNANTISEHYNSFQKYSRNNVYLINTEYGFPKMLKEIDDFDCVILHYSLFGGEIYPICVVFLKYLKNLKIPKIAFFQDEYQFCKKRFKFLNEYSIDSVYTLLDPQYYKDTYYKYTNVKKVYHTLTGYVNSNLVDITNNFFIPYEKRTLDISYRARELPYFMGKEAQEKVDIAKEFIIRLKNSDLNTDIGYTESSRVYGNAWHQMIANSKAVIGVEAGVSIFDIDGKAYEVYSEALLKNPKIAKEKIFKLLEPWEGKMFYRTISPRVFEAAAYKVCQILFEGEYNGILKPMIHYIPLKKDFSNFNEVMKILKNKKIVEELTTNAYNDLILSENYSYQKFIEDFEDTLPKNQKTNLDKENINKKLLKGHEYRYLLAKIKSLRNKHFIGREYFVKFIKYIIELKKRILDIK